MQSCSSISTLISTELSNNHHWIQCLKQPWGVYLYTSDQLTLHLFRHMLKTVHKIYLSVLESIVWSEGYVVPNPLLEIHIHIFLNLHRNLLGGFCSMCLETFLWAGDKRTKLSFIHHPLLLLLVCLLVMTIRRIIQNKNLFSYEDCGSGIFSTQGWLLALQ